MYLSILKYIINPLLIGSIFIGASNININLHKCATNGEYFYKLILGSFTENDCDSCHDEPVIIRKSCCSNEAIRNNKDNNNKCCDEKNISVKDDSIKIFSVNIISKIDYPVYYFVVFKNFSKSIILLLDFNLIPKPPDIRILLQSLTI